MKYNIQLEIAGKPVLLLLLSLLIAGGLFAGSIPTGSYAVSGMAMNLIPGDSVGQEVKDGKTFILYRVEPKETLYSIANKYNLSVAELVQHNPSTEAGLQIGAILRVPFKGVISQEGQFHTVEKQETLYSIARQYAISVEQLKSWNSLTSDAIQPGVRLRVNAPATQGSRTASATASASTENKPEASTTDFAGKIVHTVKAKETLYSISRMYDTTDEQLREWNNMSSNDLAIGQRLIVGVSQGLPGRNENERVIRNEDGLQASRTQTIYSNNPITISQIGDPSQAELETSVAGTPATTTNARARKLTELGMAMVIEDSVNTKKYLALHRTAPIGTIMQVHNEMNNLSVFVRIVGKLPDTGDHDKVLIKLSRKAFDKLGAYNEKFPVRLTYVP